MFRMVVCDAKGNILQGAEIQYPGTMYKVVRASGPGMYMIITTDICRFIPDQPGDTAADL